MCKMKGRLHNLCEGLRSRLSYTFLTVLYDKAVAEKHLVEAARERKRIKKPTEPPQTGKTCFCSDAK